MAWGTGNLGGSGGSNRSMIFVTAPEGTESVTASYNGKTIRGGFKDGKWRFSGLAYGEGVIWKVSATRKDETATENVPMPMLEIRYIELTYWKGELFVPGAPDDEVVAVTGGWRSIKQISGDSPLAEAQKNEKGQFLVQPGGRRQCFLSPAKLIDISGYKALKINIASSDVKNGKNRGFIYDKVQQDGYSIIGTRLGEFTPVEGIVSVDLSGMPNLISFAFGCYSSSPSESVHWNMVVDRIWLE